MLRGFPKEKQVSTLLFASEEAGRASGNTTRQVDFAVQQFFKYNLVIVQDHASDGENEMQNRLLLLKIERRLNEEHRMDRVKHYDCGKKQGFYFIQKILRPNG